MEKIYYSLRNKRTGNLAHITKWEYNNKYDDESDYGYDLSFNDMDENIWMVENKDTVKELYNDIIKNNKVTIGQSIPCYSFPSFNNEFPEEYQTKVKPEIVKITLKIEEE